MNRLLLLLFLIGPGMAVSQVRPVYVDTLMTADGEHPAKLAVQEEILFAQVEDSLYGIDITTEARKWSLGRDWFKETVDILAAPGSSDVLLIHKAGSAAPDSTGFKAQGGILLINTEGTIKDSVLLAFRPLDVAIDPVNRDILYLLVLSDGKHMIVRYDRRTNNVVQEILKEGEFNGCFPSAICTDQRGMLLAAVCEGEHEGVRVFDITSGIAMPAPTMGALDGGVLDVAFAENGKKMLMSVGGSLRILDITSGDTEEFTGIMTAPYYLTVHPGNGHVLCKGMVMPDIFWYDLERKRGNMLESNGETGLPIFSEDGRELFFSDFQLDQQRPVSIQYYDVRGYEPVGEETSEDTERLYGDAAWEELEYEEAAYKVSLPFKPRVEQPPTTSNTLLHKVIVEHPQFAIVIETIELDKARSKGKARQFSKSVGKRFLEKLGASTTIPKRMDVGGNTGFYYAFEKKEMHYRYFVITKGKLCYEMMMISKYDKPVVWQKMFDSFELN